MELYNDSDPIRADLIDHNEGNLQAAYSIIQQYIEQKIARNVAVDLLRPLVHSPEYIERFSVSILQQMRHVSMNTEGKPIVEGVRQKSRPWSNDEDERLLSAVREYGNSNWATIAAYVGSGRTKAQCSQRFNRVINPKISKANWTKEDEDKLIQVVSQVGTKAWTRVASQFPNRSDVQCRFKYNHIMKKMNDQSYQQSMFNGVQHPNT